MNINILRFLFIVFVTFFYSSCVSGQKEHQEETAQQDMIAEEIPEDYLSELERAFIGEWQNVSMRIKVWSYNRSDTSFIVDINEDNWDLKMTVKPIITTVYEDGSYVSEFRNSFDSLIYKPEGTWIIDGDSLIMEDHQAVYKYQIFIDGDLAEFKSIVDWDGDGETDDEYFGVQRKMR